MTTQNILLCKIGKFDALPQHYARAQGNFFVIIAGWKQIQRYQQLLKLIIFKNVDHVAKQLLTYVDSETECVSECCQIPDFRKITFAINDVVRNHFA